MKVELPLLTVWEAAVALRVQPSCIRRWLREQKVAKVKLGRLVRIPASEISRLVSEGLRPAQSRRQRTKVPVGSPPGRTGPDGG